MIEANLIQRLETKSGLDYVELPEFSRIDGQLMENKTIRYFIELKTRTHKFGDFPDAVVDYSKWNALKQLETITTIPTLLVYGWTCGTWGVVFPTKVKSYDLTAITPSLASVSLNAGVSREVVKIDLSEFTIYG
jgi:hypothetical protein